MLENTKIAATVATGTTASGLSSLLEIIPDDIGKLATVVGIALSLVLIYFHIRKGRLEKRKLELEVRELERKSNK